MKKTYIKFNCKQKRTVGNINKGINVEEYNRFKKLKIKILKQKRKKGRRRRKKENSTELQKPNIEAEVYNNDKKCN